MPGIGGFETAKRIRDTGGRRVTPIILLTAKDIDLTELEEAYALGAVDLLVKPILPFVLRAKVREFVVLFRENERTKRQA